MNDVTFCVAREFTKYPGGRLRKYGPKSGEEFREAVLVPLLNKYSHITIDLTNVMGCGSSFLDESFGELGKNLGDEEMKKRFSIIAEDDPNLVDLVWAKISIGAKEYRKK